MGLDGDKSPIDGVASNMGHLPATGLLTPDEVAAVARRLTAADMHSGWGLRTLSSRAAGYNPYSYHGGSVWPHDTAVAADRLDRAGEDAAALALIEGLVAAAPYFAYRLPELFAGETRAPGSVPIPYPSACRPQAWAAASALLIVRALLGIEADIPGGSIRIAPLEPFPYARLAARGLRVGSGRLDVVVDNGRVFVEQAPAGVDVVTG